MKKNLTKIILSLIVINLFCYLIFQTVFAVSIPDKSNEELLKIFENKPTGDTLDYLQYAASRKKNSFFDFRPSKMLDDYVQISSYANGFDDYYYDNKAVMCVSPADHKEAAKQRIECIMDVTADGVTVYSNIDGKGNENIDVTSVSRNTSDPDKKEAIKYADQLAYFAYKSLEADETKQNSSFKYYKSIMRFQLLGHKFSYFKKLGIPSKLDPKVSEIWSPGESLAFYQQKEKEWEKATESSFYTGRFVFLNGYTLSNADIGQNDCIFSAQKKERIRLKIKKVNEQGKPLKGVTFKIYYSSEKEEQGRYITKEVTNENGIINFEGIKGEWYYIKETDTVDGYEIADPDHKVVKLKEDKQEVEFVNPRKTYVKIIKENPSGKRLKGAKFEIWSVKSTVDKDGKKVDVRDEKLATKTTGSNGVINYNAEIGKKYCIIETEAPKNYKIDGENNPQIIKIDEDQSKNKVKFINEPTIPDEPDIIPDEGKYVINLYKQDSESSAYLNKVGFKFTAKIKTYEHTGTNKHEVSCDHLELLRDPYTNEVIMDSAGKTFMVPNHSTENDGYESVKDSITDEVLKDSKGYTINIPIRPHHYWDEYTYEWKEYDYYLDSAGKWQKGTIDYAHIYQTDEDGRIYISGDMNVTTADHLNEVGDAIQYADQFVGKIIATEVENPNYGYVHAVGKTYEINNGRTYIDNTSELGNLNILKCDSEDPSIVLKGVEFKLAIEGKTGGRKYIQLKDEDEKVYADKKVGSNVTIDRLNEASGEGYHVEYVDSKEQATIFVTDKKGRLTVENLEMYCDKDTKYKYILEEIANENYAYKTEVGREYEVEINTDNKIINVENSQQLGDLYIHKVDSLAPSVELEGVEFKIGVKPENDAEPMKYLQLTDSGGYVYSGGNVGSSVTLDRSGDFNKGDYQAEFISDYNQATIFTTDKNGRITIKNLEVFYDKDVKYKYYIEEISVGDKLRMYYDVKTDKDAEDDNCVLVQNTNGTPTNKDIPNTQLRVDLTGYIWEDISTGKDKMKNNLWDEGAEDKRISNIPVYLKKNGKVIAETTTDDNGSYFFAAMGRYNGEDYTIDLYKEGNPTAGEGLTQYMIEFEYNGLKYQNVIKGDSKKDETSKADDSEELRKKINDNFYNIKGNNTSRDNSGVTHGKTSTDIDLTYNTKGSDEDHKNKSELVQYTGYRDDTATGIIEKSGSTSKDLIRMLADIESSVIKDRWSEGVKTITCLNLGIYERQQADLTIATDLDSIEMRINGYAHKYNYFKRKDYLENAKKKESDPGYDAALDIFTVSAGNRYSDGYRKLSYVREIYPSYLAYTADPTVSDDSKLEVYITYTIVVKNESSSLNNTVKLRNYCDTNYELKEASVGDWEVKSDIKGAKVYETKENISVTSDKGYEEIQLTYLLSREATIGLMKDELKTKTNTTEILEYTTADSDGNYGSIDRDSAPGNSDYEVDNTYEDDIDSAPDLVIKKSAEQKTLTGTVFEDKTDIISGERLGDGKYEVGDNLANNVKVELVKRDGSVATLYTINNEAIGVKETAKQNTGSDGNSEGTYKFVGLIPDIYYLKYTYGTGKEGEETINTTIKDKTINKDVAVVPEKYKSTIVKYDTAKELLGRQTNDIITKDSDENSYWKYPGNDKDTDIKDKDNREFKAYWYEESEAETHSASVDNYVRRLYINDKLSDFGYDKKTGYDTGISDSSHKYDDDNKLYVMTAQTPIMSIAIEEKDKDITDSDYTPIHSYETKFGIAKRPRQDFEVKKEISYVKVILANGQILLEGDPSKNDEIASYVTYPPNGRVKIEIDSEILQGATLEITYKINVRNLSDVNYNTRGYYNFGDNKTNKVATTIKLIDYMDKEISYYENGEWKVKKTEEVKDLENLSDFTKKMSDYNFIIQNGDITLKPGEEKFVEIKASKLLTTTKDIWYDNKVEFYNVKNPVGRFYDKEGTPEKPDGDPQTPGNYGDKDKECDNNKDPVRAELTIVPPTGQTRIYYVIGISSLVLLVGGIVLIKKKVLK